MFCANEVKVYSQRGLGESGVERLCFLVFESSHSIRLFISCGQ